MPIDASWQHITEKTNDSLWLVQYSWRNVWCCSAQGCSKGSAYSVLFGPSERIRIMTWERDEWDFPGCVKCYVKHIEHAVRKTVPTCWKTLLFTWASFIELFIWTGKYITNLSMNFFDPNSENWSPASSFSGSKTPAGAHWIVALFCHVPDLSSVLSSRPLNNKCCVVKDPPQVLIIAIAEVSGRRPGEVGWGH